MKDNYSPSYSMPGEGEMSSQPIPMPDTSAPDYSHLQVPEFDFDIPELEDIDKVESIFLT